MAARQGLSRALRGVCSSSNSSTWISSNFPTASSFVIAARGGVASTSAPSNSTSSTASAASASASSSIMSAVFFSSSSSAAAAILRSFASSASSLTSATCAAGASAPTTAAAAAAAQGEEEEEETLEQIRSRIFGTAIGDGRPSGRKVLRKKLVGDVVASYYPDNPAAHDPLFVDLDDVKRKAKLERMRRRGKTPPKKGEGRRSKKK